MYACTISADRSRRARLKTAILFSAILGMNIILPPAGSFGLIVNEAKKSWWFPNDLLAGHLYDYHVHVVLKFRHGESTATWDEKADFTIAVSRDEEKDGCILKLHRVKGPEGSALAAILSGFINENDKGIRITDDEVLFREGPLIRGPWKQGDRMTFATFVMTFFGSGIGVSHVEVRSVDDAKVHLTSDFWLGGDEPELNGRGEVSFTKDEKGITGVAAKSRWGNEKTESRLELSIERRRIYPQQEEKKDETRQDAQP